MKIKLLMIIGLFVFGMHSVFAEEPLDLLISPLIGEIHVPGYPSDVFIIRDIKNSLTWELTHPKIEGLDYVEGNTYLISVKKLLTLPLVEYSKYELIEIKQVFKSHEPYSWKSLCVPGYHVWIDGNCVFSFRCSEYAYPGKLCVTNSVEQDYLRPLQQEKVGILPEDVICLEFLQLVINDNIPACVKSSSVDKLLERGFTLAKNNNESPYT